jgi:hypothetical protein
MKRQYRLYTYDVWGNARDGFEVNDVYATSTHIELMEESTDYQINRLLGGRGIKWEGEYGYTLYGKNKRNGRPIAELRALPN